MPRRKGEVEANVIQTAQWLELRATGQTLRQIAETADVSYETVRRRVTRYLEEHPASKAHDYRLIQLAGYDRMKRALSPGVEAGDVKAIGEMRKVYEAEARLLGLNAATKTELTVEVKEDPAILERVEAQRLVNAQARAALQSAPIKALHSAPIDVVDAELVEDGEQS